VKMLCDGVHKNSSKKESYIDAGAHDPLVDSVTKVFSIEAGMGSI
jgi:hypothetical protein